MSLKELDIKIKRYNLRIKNGYIKLVQYEYGFSIELVICYCDKYCFNKKSGASYGFGFGWSDVPKGEYVKVIKKLVEMANNTKLRCL